LGAIARAAPPDAQPLTPHRVCYWAPINRAIRSGGPILSMAGPQLPSGRVDPLRPWSRREVDGGDSGTVLSAGLPVPAGGARPAGPAEGRHPLCRRRLVRQPGRPPSPAPASRPRAQRPAHDRVQRRLPLAGRRPRRLPGDQRNGPGPPRDQGQRRGRTRLR
jgi:hypothetical protein